MDFSIPRRPVQKEVSVQTEVTFFKSKKPPVTDDTIQIAQNLYYLHPAYYIDRQVITLLLLLLL